MKHTEKEMLELREEVTQMWKLVISQLEKAKQALLTHDIELAREVSSREKRVDVFELKIDSDCENYIALFSPVAIDLRLSLSLMKITAMLERIGDFAAGIARFVIDETDRQPDFELFDELEMAQTFDTLLGMLSDAYVALDSENTKIVGKIIGEDEKVDRFYHRAIDVMTAYLQKHPEVAAYCLRLIILVRKMERIGDHCSNIVEEITFYVDAKVLKHSKLKNENL